MRLTWVLAATAAVLLLAVASVGVGTTPSAVAGVNRGSCPHHVFPERALAAKNRNPGSAEATVPGHPVRLLLCRYRGLNSGKRSLTLGAQRKVARQKTVASIAGELNDLEPLPEGTLYCPADDGSRLYALFSYAGEPRVVVEVRFRGCAQASNGHHRAGWLSPRLSRRLKHLTPHSS